MRPTKFRYQSFVVIKNVPTKVPVGTFCHKFNNFIFLNNNNTIYYITTINHMQLINADITIRKSLTRQLYLMNIVSYHIGIIHLSSIVPSLFKLAQLYTLSI